LSSGCIGRNGSGLDGHLSLALGHFGEILDDLQVAT
jgi:hypothetical protein